MPRIVKITTMKVDKVIIYLVVFSSSSSMDGRVDSVKMWCSSSVCR